MKSKIILLLVYIFIGTLPCHGQLANDSHLFTIQLIDDASQQNLFNIHRAKWVRQALSGPVVMKDDNLLFYSEKGYVLYNETGTIVDSHSVFGHNAGMERNDSNRITLAFPVTNNKLLFYTNVPQEKYPLTLFEKRLFKRTKVDVKESEYESYKSLRKKHIFNFAFNSATDEMRDYYYITTRLIGFSSVSSGNKWWSIDKIYSFRSPLVMEDDGEYKSLFPGIHQGNNKPGILTIEPLQIFTRDTKWYYTGISEGGAGSVKEKRFQTYHVFDQAGNELYADTLLKLDNIEAIIGEDEENYYTMKKVKRKVFNPSVSRNGNLFYGIIDNKKKKIEVRKRQYYCYTPSSCTPDLDDLIDNEKNVEFIPVELKCNRKETESPAIPKITLLDIKSNKFVRAKKEHLTHEGYICYLHRNTNRAVKKKLSRSRGDVPGRVRKIIKSLSGNSEITCPYSISLEGPKGLIRSFSFPAGDEIVCARVMALYKSDEILIRVDFETYAEALLFKTDGTYINSFIFNRQNYEERLDILVTSKNSPLIELDYESNPETHTYLEWKKSLID